MELENYHKAKGELEKMGAWSPIHPEAPQVNWMICTRLEKWEDSFEVASVCISRDPDSQFARRQQAFSIIRMPGGG